MTCPQGNHAGFPIPIPAQTNIPVPVQVLVAVGGGAATPVNFVCSAGAI